LGTKWWIGGSGHISTHTVALCKLIIEGKECGLYWFIVPLRDPNTGELYPGVTAGSLGCKFFQWDD
jgi:acyl-CoA oxidase